ncbi:MAG: hypothetical protein JWP84_3481 [Tardiphaga sp.]|nr:hypothetical protein [Tardiphaga sp.]
MVDDRPDDTGPSPELGRPKRAPPTIELQATEVTTETADIGADTTAAAQEAQESAASSEPAPEAAPSPDPKPHSEPRARRSSPLISAGTGAVAAALVVGAAWLAGWPGSVAPEPAPQADTSAIDALTARVARVESRAAAPPAAPSSATPDPAITARLDTLEKSLASLRSDLAAAKSQSERAAAAVNDLKSVPRDAAAPVDLAPITERLAQVERATGALKTEAAQQSAKPADDRPLRRVVAASLLDATVRQGEPYAAALAAAKPLAVDANVLKPLDAFAASGVPNAAALSRDLLALLSKLAPAPDSAATTGTGIVDRLQAGAARLVRIERTDAVAGDNRSAVASRAAAAARRNDIVEAKRELYTLAPADRVAVQPWIDKVDAHDAALAASRQFAADAMAALSKPAP